MSRAGKWSIAIIFLIIICLAGGFWLGRKAQNLKLPRIEKPEKKQLPEPEKPSPREAEKTPLPFSLNLPKGLSEFEQRVMQSANLAMPAVVNIYTEKKVKIDTGPFFPFFNDPFFRRFFGDRFFFQMPREQIQRSLGSGVIVREDGYILTNNHVIKEADKIKVSLLDKRGFSAKVIGTDPKTDLALLKIDADNLPVLPLGDSDQLEIGQFVLAIGNPFGLSGTVTMGIVSAKGRANLRIADYEDFIQTDAAINPGNSGGALINLKGELVGINTAIFSRSGGYMGIGFAIPSNMAKAVMESLLKYGKVVRGWLGVSIQELTPELKKSFDYQGTGVLVAEVLPETPAEKAGIKPGDIIVEYNGEKIESVFQLKNLVAETHPGTEAEIKIFREGKYLTLKTKIAELKESSPAISSAPSSPSARLGMEVSELTPELRKSYNLPAGLEGVMITALEPGGRAERAGLKIGDVILKVNRTRVRTARDFWKAAEASGKNQILLWVWREGANLFLVIPAED